MPATATKAPRGTSNGATPATVVAEPYAAMVRLDDIDVADNVRANLGDLDELVESIRQHGVLEPVRVRAKDGGRAVLVFGHRRFAAAKLAGLEQILAIVDTGEQASADRTVQQLVENIQRRDLNALEEAKALRRILDEEKGLTHDALADRVGRARPSVTNLLRILDLEPGVQVQIATGALSAAHGKALLGFSGSGQVKLAKEAVEYGFSAHEVERRIQAHRDQEAREKQEIEAAGKLAKTLEAELLAKGATKASTRLVADYYGGRGLLGAMKSLGWKVADRHGEGRSKTCDCDAYVVGTSGYGRETKPVAKRTCVNAKHVEAKRHAESSSYDERWKKQAEKDRIEREERDRIRGPLTTFLAVNPRSAEARRATLFAIAMAHYNLSSTLAARAGVEVDAYNPKKSWLAIAEIPDKDLDGHIAFLVAYKVTEKPLPVIRDAFVASVPEMAAQGKDAPPELPALTEGLEWRRARRMPNGGWLPAVHAFAVKAPTGNKGGSVPALAACGLATGAIAESRIPVKRTIECDQVLGLEDKRLHGLKPVPACTACEKAATS